MPPVELSAAAVREFYDEFFHSRMLRYRLWGNARIERALHFILPYVREGSRVLEIGCGIGLVAERIARRRPSAQVSAVDISEQNIWYAQRTVKRSNVRFFACDVLNDFESLERQLPGPVDVVLLVDVLEHLPLAWHAELFRRIAAVSAADAVILITCPSPQYQRFLHERHPEELQLVDEIIEVGALVETMQAAGFTLRQLSLEDVWMRDQYLHCAFQRHGGSAPGVVAEPARVHRGRWEQLGRRVLSRLLVPYRKYRYVHRVFGRR